MRRMTNSARRTCSSYSRSSRCRRRSDSAALLGWNECLECAKSVEMRRRCSTLLGLNSFTAADAKNRAGFERPPLIPADGEGGGRGNYALARARRCRNSCANRLSLATFFGFFAWPKSQMVLTVEKLPATRRFSLAAARMCGTTISK